MANSMYDTPDMGIGDVLSLSRIAQPIMRGNAPVGAGATAGAEYENDRHRQQGYMNQANSLAQLQALVKGESARNYMDAAPSRDADIQTNNSLAQGRLGTISDLLEKQNTEAKTGSIKATNAQIDEIKNTVGKYAGTWAQAETNQDKEAVREMMMSAGVKKIGNKNLADIPLDRLDRVMLMSRGEQVNTPAQVGKLQIADKVGGYRESVADITGEHGENKADIAGKYSLMRAMLRKKGQEDELKVRKEIADGKLSKTQWEGQMLKKMEAGVMTPTEEATWTHYLTKELERDRARNANQAPTVNPEIVNPPPDSGKPNVLNSPTTPKPTAIPQQNKLDLDTGVYIENQGKNKVKIKSQRTVNGKTQYELEDGRKFNEDGSPVK